MHRSIYVLSLDLFGVIDSVGYLTHAGEAERALRGGELLPRRLLKPDLVDHGRKLVSDRVMQKVKESGVGEGENQNQSRQKRGH